MPVHSRDAEQYGENPQAQPEDTEEDRYGEQDYNQDDDPRRKEFPIV